MINKLLKFIRRYSFILGIILFFVILGRTDLRELSRVLTGANFYQLIIFLPILLVPHYFLKAYRWNYLKKRQKINYKIQDSLLMTAAGTLVGIATPSRLGELTRILYLKKDGYPVIKSLVSVILDRIYDFLFLVIFGYLGMLYLANFFQTQVVFISMLILILLAFLFLVLKTPKIKALLRKIFYVLISLKYRETLRIDSNVKEFFNNLRVYNLKDHLLIFWITCAFWLSYYLMVYILAQSIGLNIIPFLYLAIVITVANLINLLPISIAGLGTREATLLVLLGELGIARAEIISFSLLCLSLYLMVGMVGIWGWIKKPIPF